MEMQDYLVGGSWREAVVGADAGGHGGIGVAANGGGDGGAVAKEPREERRISVERAAGTNPVTAAAEQSEAEHEAQREELGEGAALCVRHCALGRADRAGGEILRARLPSQVRALLLVRAASERRALFSSAIILPLAC